MMDTLEFSSAVTVQLRDRVSPCRACTGPLVFRYTAVILLTGGGKRKRGKEREGKRKEERVT